jgi:hypothetical protein
VCSIVYFVLWVRVMLVLLCQLLDWCLPCLVSTVYHLLIRCSFFESKEHFLERLHLMVAGSRRRSSRSPVHLCQTGLCVCLLCLFFIRAFLLRDVGVLLGFSPIFRGFYLFSLLIHSLFLFLFLFLFVSVLVWLVPHVVLRSV